MNVMKQALEAAKVEHRLVHELLTAIEAAAEDIGGCRPPSEIIKELGPAYERFQHCLIVLNKPQCYRYTQYGEGRLTGGSGSITIADLAESIELDAQEIEVIVRLEVGAKWQRADGVRLERIE